MNAFCRDDLPSGRITNTSTAVDPPTFTECCLDGRVHPQIACVFGRELHIRRKQNIKQVLTRFPNDRLALMVDDEPSDKLFNSDG